MLPDVLQNSFHSRGEIGTQFLSPLGCSLTISIPFWTTAGLCPKTCPAQEFALAVAWAFTFVHLSYGRFSLGFLGAGHQAQPFSFCI